MTASRSKLVGIDLGTTYSLVAVLSGDQPVVLPNALGELLTPSAVSVAEDGTILVGAPARARATTHPTRTALAFKRDMGTDRTYSLGDRTFTPAELSACVLRALKHDAEAALGHPVEEAIVTVPAYFGDLQRQATRDAGAIAGLKVERIVNEPTAAALAYGLHERTRELKAAVLDLGGGTFDVTVIEIIEGVVEVLASAGDARLGGEDFVDALAGAMADEIDKTHRSDVRDEPTSWARLREACELAKKRLSADPTARVVLPALALGKVAHAIERDVTRDEADALWQPLMERMRAPIARALRDASLRPEQIDEVLLVGGATRMPCVVRLASQMFGRLPLRTLPPDEAVAMGAAVQAALKEGAAAVEDLVVTDVAPFTMGIASSSKMGRQLVDGLFTPILERGTVIPASRVERFFTMEDHQREIAVQVYQGEHSHCRDNQKLGELVVRGLPSAAAGKESIDVRFTYDLNGILDVDTTVVSTGKTESLVIERSPGRLSKRDVEKARDAMRRLKFHPRDALPNATALARADALYAELTGVERSILGESIAHLRTALEAQGPERITECRESLVALTASLRKAPH